MKPSIGRIVHFYWDRGGPVAAIVIEIDPDDDMAIGIRTFEADDSVGYAAMISHESNHREKGSEWYWCWPPRVE